MNLALLKKIHALPLVITFATLATASGSAFADSRMNKAIDSPSYKQSVDTYKTCLKMPPATFKKLEAAAQKQCIANMSDFVSELTDEQLEQELADCMGYTIIDLTQLSDPAIDACEEMAVNAAFEAEMGISGEEFKNMSNEERQAFFMKKSQENPIEQGDNMPDEIISSLEMPDMSEITLPVPPSSTQIVHLSVQQSSEMMSSMLDETIDALAAVTIASPMTAQELTDFYKKALPSYKVFNEADQIIFMQKAPADFTILTHMKLYFATEHVVIKSDSGKNNLLPSLNIPESTKSIIEIAYKPKDS